MIPSKIVCPKTGNAASVTQYGQLIVAPVDYSSLTQENLTVVDTAYVFVTPLAGHSIVVTDLLISTDKNVGVNGASLQIYTASEADSVTITGGVLDVEMLKNTNRDLTGLNVLITEGLWLLAKTDDNNVNITIAYYYVPVV